MSSAVYSTADWQKARKLALERDNWRCSAVEGYDVVLNRDPDGNVEAVEVPVYCTATSLLDVHHIEPVRLGGAPFDLDNLMTLCTDHHHEMHAMLRESGDSDVPLTREQEMVEDLLDAVRLTTLGQGLELPVAA